MFGHRRRPPETAGEEVQLARTEGLKCLPQRPGHGVLLAGLDVSKTGSPHTKRFRGSSDLSVAVLSVAVP